MIIEVFDVGAGSLRFAAPFQEWYRRKQWLSSLPTKNELEPLWVVYILS